MPVEFSSCSDEELDRVIDTNRRMRSRRRQRDDRAIDVMVTPSAGVADARLAGSGGSVHSTVQVGNNRIAVRRGTIFRVTNNTYVSVLRAKHRPEQFFGRASVHIRDRCALSSALVRLHCVVAGPLDDDSTPLTCSDARVASSVHHLPTVTLADADVRGFYLFLGDDAEQDPQGCVCGTSSPKRCSDSLLTKDLPFRLQVRLPIGSCGGDQRRGYDRFCASASKLRTASSERENMDDKAWVHLHAFYEGYDDVPFIVRKAVLIYGQSPLTLLIDHGNGRSSIWIDGALDAASPPRFQRRVKCTVPCPDAKTVLLSNTVATSQRDADSNMLRISTLRNEPFFPAGAAPIPARRALVTPTVCGALGPPANALHCKTRRELSVVECEQELVFSSKWGLEFASLPIEIDDLNQELSYTLSRVPRNSLWRANRPVTAIAGSSRTLCASRHSFLGVGASNDFALVVHDPQSNRAWVQSRIGSDGRSTDGHAPALPLCMDVRFVTVGGGICFLSSHVDGLCRLWDVRHLSARPVVVYGDEAAVDRTRGRGCSFAIFEDYLSVSAQDEMARIFHIASGGLVGPVVHRALGPNHPQVLFRYRQPQSITTSSDLCIASYARDSTWDVCSCPC